MVAKTTSGFDIKYQLVTPGFPAGMWISSHLSARPRSLLSLALPP